MTKIGCVLAYCNNYGTMLQSYATIKTVKSLGYDFEIIRYKKSFNLWKKLQLLFAFIRIGDWSKKRRLKNKIALIIHPSYKKNKRVKDKAFQRFASERLIPFFKEYHGYESLKEGSKNYDLVLVGSDQIWSLMSLYGGFYNLMFVDDNVPKVSYASSFGVPKIPSFQQKATKEYLDRFSIIGVREQSGKDIVDSLSVNKATVVADPSILLTAKKWEEEIKDIEIEAHRPYIFCYFLGNNKQHRVAVEELKKITNYEIIAVCHNDEYVRSDEGFGDYVPYNVGPLKFLKYIHEADFVCTDSFHCSVFSILFHKKFMSFYRYLEESKESRNTRIDSLLSIFSLTDRIYRGDIRAILNDIDYNETEKKVCVYRNESMEFLTQELNLSKSKR
ncbi:MAG: polysaccharide pyruvyl transferase family protein [Paludibacteraceae bacterium]|nr:polysaccharide pyruvyl transferase family protein [Paludibacteraceae bacterium]